ncbi:hypothetical protein Caci_2222 [Catenulispora acidiphila DSM 44928]|uniref:Uncharacterized protein n=1 Tax=Catenulispora acidiphila (strain DSM 44928 / JCM 14897 / NBRC 102108 / NRRL B-24433 / ID139908) TaxID=479433 RepID=C7QHW6_CATAD|nr:hypothetical protein [Catenulispora acidiphila]ACU71141.1 hypothetical protein Caci_2222 [Catenulispora acidiphila DSM 44928]
MSKEIVRFNGDRNEVVATLPNVLPGSLTRMAVVKAIATAAENTAYALASARYAVVKVVTETSLQIEFLNERRRVIREDIIPVLAISQSHNDARRAVYNMSLDDDIRQDALADLDRARQRRRDRL